MKAQGIMKKKYDRKSGLNYGDIIELIPDRKVEEAVKDAVKGISKEGEAVCWAENIEVGSDLHFNSQGEKFFSKYNNNYYKASGKVVIRTLNAKTDKLRPAKTYKFKIEFCDCLDTINQPDLKVKEFSIDEVKR